MEPEQTPPEGQKPENTPQPLVIMGGKAYTIGGPPDGPPGTEAQIQAWLDKKLKNFEKNERRRQTKNRFGRR